MSISSTPVDPAHPPITFEQAVAHVRNADWPAAWSAYTCLAQQHPGEVEILCNLGLIEQILDDGTAALGSFTRAVDLRPESARPYLLRADLHKSCGRLSQALADYDSALSRCEAHDPALAHVHANRGTTLHALGRHEEALTSFDQAERCDAQVPGIDYNRGNALRSLGRHQQALESFDHALTLDGADVQAQFNRGLSLGALSRWQEALQAADSVLNARPEHAAAHSARGDYLKNLGRPEEALLAYGQALALDAERASTHLNRGNTLRELGRHQEALAAYERVIALNPSDWEGHYNQGIALHDLRRLPQALRAYSLARRLAPQEAQIEWNEALALLLSQHWHEGWLAYESRWRMEAANRPWAAQAGVLWRGAPPPQGMRLLLEAEQGLGDTLQFCRYVPEIVDRGARVTLLVPEVLRPLLESLMNGRRPEPVAARPNAAGGSLSVVSQLNPQSQFDGHCSLMSLPLALQRYAPDAADGAPYLHADPTLRASLVQRYPRFGDRLRVGLAWSGNARNPSDAQRSMKLAEMVACLPSNIETVVLQSDIRPEDEAALAALPGLIHDRSALQGFGPTAAWCAEVDLVITVDTSIAHLAGALGVPTWILLHHAADWRWLLDRSDTPWYESTRLFRQLRPGDWSAPVEAVQTALNQALA